MAIPVAELLSTDILKPARYLGNELGAVRKPWDAATVRWVLSYPEIYEVGASNLGHIILYNILNTVPDQLCDRAYLPAADLAQKLRTTQTPLFAVESRRPLADFDLIGFSLSYELGATNILEMLDLAGLPLTWAERQHTTEIPLIFAGGQTATSNPEPYADFFDFFALGDGEELLPEIGLVVADAKRAGLSRQETLLDLAQVPGVYVPQFYDRQPDGAVVPNRADVPERILRRVATPLPAYAVGLVPYVETVHDRLTVEIRRGCTRGCRFCQPGMLTRPARDVAPDEVIAAIETGMRATGYNEFSLLSLSCSDYLALPAVGVEIKNRLRHEQISLSLPSQRVDRFDENIAHIVGGTRQSSLTFAPEAGTQRLRDIINKGLTNEELLRGVKTAYEQGWDKVKLYFMIGLPGETDADVLGIAETIRWLKRECWMKGRKPLNFHLTISNFTPKPHTPFQWHAVSTAEFERKQALLKAEFRTIRGLKVNFTDVRISAMEDFVGRGDRQLGAVIRRAWELGAREDSWWESLDRAYAAWTQAIAEAGLDWKYRQLEAGEWNVFSGEAAALDAPLPWDHIDTGISKAWLKEDLQRALAAVVVPDCSFAGCSHCGVCGLDFGHNVVVPPPPIPAIQEQCRPPQERVQRLRLTFGKVGSMTLISHLDLLRLLERAVRRAHLPIAFSGGFHPSPRIATASALPLGMASEGELVDLEFHQPVDPEVVLSQLRQQLPPELPLYCCEVVPLSAPAASQALVAATYELLICAPDECSLPEWEEVLQTLRATAEVPYELTTKSGKSKIINLRDRLLEIALTPEQPHWPTLRLIYKGVCRNDGTFLRPEHCLHLLEVASGRSLVLQRVTRRQLHLESCSP
ncbi:TIGR03960 family B12-binding radical SAM protein [Synechococcus sp. PCC 6716]|nr:TIGR03960 family B12-binding radical SAM protein [Synechococcus sp. PCC 6716]